MFALRFFAVFDSPFRAGADAGHAMRAGIVPDGSAGFKADIPQRADGGAAAAGDALVSGIEGFGSDKPLIVRLEDHFC